MKSKIRGGKCPLRISSFAFLLDFVIRILDLPADSVPPRQLGSLPTSRGFLPSIGPLGRPGCRNLQNIDASRCGGPSHHPGEPPIPPCKSVRLPGDRIPAAKCHSTRQFQQPATTIPGPSGRVAIAHLTYLTLLTI